MNTGWRAFRRIAAYAGAWNIATIVAGNDAGLPAWLIVPAGVASMLFDFSEFFGTDPEMKRLLEREPALAPASPEGDAA